MNGQVTTRETLVRLQNDAAFTATSPRPLPSARAVASRAVDIVAFLFLVVFQMASVIALAWNAPQIGQMGLVVFGIIFVWLGATLAIGLGDWVSG